MPFLDAAVAVIGAGFAGLACARTVRAPGRSVVVLEARDRVGGRVYDEKLSGDALFERGAQWLGNQQHRMHALANEYGLEQFPTFEEGSNVFEHHYGKLSHYRGTVPNVRVYSDPFWRANGLSGQSTSTTGPVKVTFDNSPPSGTPGILLGFLE